ncbi:MAG: rhodanese-like domain-containing protein [Candidatus Methylomirabilales bacterium]
MAIRTLIPGMAWSLVLLALAGTAAMAGMPKRAAQATAPGYTNLTPATLKSMLERKDFTFVNVHVPYEGEIPQTDAFIPFNEIEQQAGKLPAAKDAKIVLYCMSDRMSTIAAEKLVRLGYTHVWNLRGGMAAWRNQGHSLLEKR